MASTAVAPTSLDTSSVLRPLWILRLSGSPDRCPRFPFEWVNTETGEVNLGSCKSIRCEVCGVREIRRRAYRGAAANPERMLTLTALPPGFQEARAAEARLLRLLRRRGYVIEWLIAHELTDSGLRHAHALCKGSYIPQRVISGLAERAGMGRVVYIERIADGGGATAYALKEALQVVRYATKGTAELEDHLTLNGGRLYRVTRGYFRDA